MVDRNELESVYSLNSQEIRARLEKALHATITFAEWAFLEDRGLVHDYEITGDWPEFRGGVEDNLKAIRRFRANDLRERTGELEEEPRENDVYYETENVPVDPEDRAFARFLALDALNRLRSGGSAPARATMQSTLLPRGGADGTVPQLVHVIATELWMPAAEVARSFRAMQRTLMVDSDQPRTQARAYNVARFVWRMQAALGERPPWQEME
jgi:hypothetical protein